MIQFERAVLEYAVWLAVPEDERSPAPAWWWSSALAMRGSVLPMPAEWALPMGLPADSTIGTGARLMVTAFADQTRQPWPEEFPRRLTTRDASETRATGSDAPSSGTTPGSIGS